MGSEVLAGVGVQYGYGILFAAIVLDNAGLPIPGELFLLTAGALGRTGDLPLPVSLLVAAAAAVSGDIISCWLGRLAGERVVNTYCRLTLGSGLCVRRAAAYYQRYGKPTVIVGRFVMGVRAFLAPLAGSAGMPFGQFLLFDSLGALLWALIFELIGYAFGWRLDRLHNEYRDAGKVLLTVVGTGLATYLVVKFVRRRRRGRAVLRPRMMARVVGAIRRSPDRKCASTAPPLTTGASAARSLRDRRAEKVA